MENGWDNGASKSDHERVISNYVRLWKDNKEDGLLSYLEMPHSQLVQIERAMFGDKEIPRLKLHYEFDCQGFARDQQLDSPVDALDYRNLFVVYGFVLNVRWNTIVSEINMDLCDDLLDKLYGLYSVFHLLEDLQKSNLFLQPASLLKNLTQKNP